MPITQERLIALVEAGRYYSKALENTREKIRALMPNAHMALYSLENNNQLTDQTQKQITVIWETLQSVISELKEIAFDEFEAHRTLTKEEAHFSKSTRTHNLSQRFYQRRRRAARNEITDSELPASLGKPIKTTPRNDPETDRQMNEVHRRLWEIEEIESWRASELVDVISATIPKQSPTAILNEMVATGRIAYVKATDKYIIENPESAQAGESVQAATDESAAL